MMDKIENVFRELMAALQMARLYPDWHPQFKKAVEKAYDSLGVALKLDVEIVFGIIGEELAFDKEIFFDLSKIVKPMILFLKERNIERIVFLRGLEIEELSRFLTFLAMPKEEILKGSTQEHLDRLKIKNIVVGKIKASNENIMPKDAEKAINYLNIYDKSLANVSDSIDLVLSQQDLNYLNLKMTLTDIVDNLLGRYQEFLNFSTLKRYDIRTFVHILNVSILSMYFSSKIGFPKDEVLEIGTAALFHDIGKIYISRKIIGKPEELTKDEFSRIANHSAAGARIMLKYVNSLGALPAVVCYEHHLRYDLSGYPKSEFYQKQHIASSIVCLCDVYDALTSRRVYKGNFPPEVIYKLMLRDRGTMFDPELLDRFFKTIGVWPVGALVLLSDKRIAVVRQVNELDIFSPKVEVVSPIDAKEILDLAALKDKIKIERSLNPLTEGKDYLSSSN